MSFVATDALLERLFAPPATHTLLAAGRSDFALSTAAAAAAAAAVAPCVALVSLRTLVLSRSAVTDGGLGFLRGETLRRLAAVDVTFCHGLETRGARGPSGGAFGFGGVSYGGCARLRQRHAALQVQHSLDAPAATASAATAPPLEVLRLPTWLVGTFITPFKNHTVGNGTGGVSGGGGGGGGVGDGGGDGGCGGGGAGYGGGSGGGGAERHTYYADGSFSFGRGSQAHGFVRVLREVGHRGPSPPEPAAWSYSYSSASWAPSPLLFPLPSPAASSSLATELHDSLQYVDFSPDGWCERCCLHSWAGLHSLPRLSVSSSALFARSTCARGRSPGLTGLASRTGRALPSSTSAPP